MNLVLLIAIEVARITAICAAGYFIIIEIIARIITGPLLPDAPTRAWLLKKRNMMIYHPDLNLVEVFGAGNPLTYISTHPTGGPLTSRYYIYGHGRIPRWSKTHRFVKKLFRQFQSAPPQTIYL